MVNNIFFFSSIFMCELLLIQLWIFTLRVLFNLSIFSIGNLTREHSMLDRKKNLLVHEKDFHVKNISIIFCIANMIIFLIFS